MTELLIREISDLVTAARSSGKDFGGFVPWWRGQGDAEWKLVPSVLREAERAAKEQYLVANFMRQAPVLYPNCPPKTYWADWLYLMQHYRLYTRLLDWTESILVATFFAVTDGTSKAAALWALDPGALNESQGMERNIAYFAGENVHPLFKEAVFGRSPKGGDHSKRILGVATTSVDFRMQAQSAAWTIHGGELPLENLDGNNKFLIKFEIPQESKGRLKADLTLLGIKSSYLFPDLENLAAYLNEQ